MDLADQFYAAAESLSQRYTHVLKMAGRNDTDYLQGELEERMYNLFRMLVPLSYSPIAIKVKKNSDDISKMRVHSWVRYTESYATWKSLGSVVGAGQMFWLVRALPDDIKNRLRETIRRPLYELRDLALKLQSYENITVRKRLNRECAEILLDSDGLEAAHFKVTSLAAESNNPLQLKPHATKSASISDTIDLTEIESLPIIENILPEVESLYQDLNTKVQLVKERNARILSQMERVVGPFQLLRPNEEIKG